MRARLLTTATICLSLAFLAGCSGDTVREIAGGVDPAVTDPAQPAPPEGMQATLAAWDTLTVDFQHLFKSLGSSGQQPATLSAVEQQYGYLFSDGVRIADWDPRGATGALNERRFCLTGPSDTYLAFAATVTNDGPDGLVFNRIWGTGDCKYDTGDIITEINPMASLQRGVVESLRSDTLSVAVAVEKWATDHPGRLPATTKSLFGGPYGLTLTPGNTVASYTVTGGTYQVCVRHGSGAWGSLTVTSDNRRHRSWPVQAVGLDGGCTYEEMSDKAYDDLLASLPAAQETAIRGADLAAQVPTLVEHPLHEMFRVG